MGCFGTDLGMLFHLYKGLFVIHEVFEKFEKKEQKVGVTRLLVRKSLVKVVLTESAMNFYNQILEVYFPQESGFN